MSQAKAYMSIHESILWQVWVWKQGSPKSHGLEMFRIMFPLKTDIWGWCSTFWVCFMICIRTVMVTGSVEGSYDFMKRPTFCWLNANFLCWNVATCHLNILKPSLRQEQNNTNISLIPIFLPYYCVLYPHISHISPKAWFANCPLVRNGDDGRRKSHGRWSMEFWETLYSHVLIIPELNKSNIGYILICTII